MQVLPDLLSSARMARVTSRLKADLDRSAMEAVTGERRDVTRAVNGQLGQVHRLRAQIAGAEASETRLAVAEGRHRTAGAALSALRTSTQNLGIEALNAAVAGGATGVDAFARRASAALADASGRLNSRFDGRALFAGAAADGQAIDADALLSGIDAALAAAAPTAAARIAALDAFFAPGGGFDAAYRGDAAPASEAPLPDGSALDPLPRGDEGAVRDLLRGLSLVAAAADLPQTDAVALARAGTGALRAAGEGLAAWEASVGLGLARIDAARGQAADDARVASGLLSNLTGRDAFEAASEAQDFETRLQAAYQITARLGRLSITDYL